MTWRVRDKRSRKPLSSKMCIEDIRYENSGHVKRGHLNDVVHSKCVSELKFRYLKYQNIYLAIDNSMSYH